LVSVFNVRGVRIKGEGIPTNFFSYFTIAVSPHVVVLCPLLPIGWIWRNYKVFSLLFLEDKKKSSLVEKGETYDIDHPKCENSSLNNNGGEINN